MTCSTIASSPSSGIGVFKTYTTLLVERRKCIFFCYLLKSTHSNLSSLEKLATMCFIAATIDYHKIVSFDCWLCSSQNKVKIINDNQISNGIVMASPGLDGSVRKNIEDECPIIDEVLVDVPVVNEAHEAQVDEAVVHEGPVDDMGNDKVINDVGNVKRVIDKGKGIMIDDVPVVGRKMGVRNKGIVIEENVNPAMYDQSETDSDNEQRVNDDMFNYDMYVDDSDSEYLDKSFDYLSESEDEVRELRKRNFDAKRAPNPPKQNIDNVGTSKPKRVHDFGDSETVIEHEEFMDDLMRKLKRVDHEMEDPFKIVETKVEKYPIHDEDTHWRMRKRKVGEKFVNAEQLKEC
ncbi:hypothetical protein Tco_0547755 [Tanacetum coccineum]